jgi:hypothetical protein
MTKEEVQIETWPYTVRLERVSGVEFRITGPKNSLVELENETTRLGRANCILVNGVFYEILGRLDEGSHYRLYVRQSENQSATSQDS